MGNSPSRRGLMSCFKPNPKLSFMNKICLNHNYGAWRSGLFVLLPVVIVYIQPNTLMFIHTKYTKISCVPLTILAPRSLVSRLAFASVGRHTYATILTFGATGIFFLKPCSRTENTSS